MNSVTSVFCFGWVVPSMGGGAVAAATGANAFLVHKNKYTSEGSRGNGIEHAYLSNPFKYIKLWQNLHRLGLL